MPRSRLNRISLAILAAGFIAAAVIFFAAGGDQDDDALRDDPLGRKRFSHDVQVMGGKANLLAADFQTWFDGLWHGRALAGTVLVLTVAGTLGFRFVATLPLPPPSGRATQRGGDKR